MTHLELEQQCLLEQADALALLAQIIPANSELLRIAANHSPSAEWLGDEADNPFE